MAVVIAYTDQCDHCLSAHNILGSSANLVGQLAHHMRL